MHATWASWAYERVANAAPRPTAPAATVKRRAREENEAFAEEWMKDFERVEEARRSVENTRGLNMIAKDSPFDE